MNDRIQMVAELEANGFKYYRSSKHSTLFRDDYGITIGIAHTPSDVRAFRNVRSELKAALAKRPTQQEITVSVTPPDKQHLPTVDPAVVADRKQCASCRTFLPLGNFRPTPGNPKLFMRSCNACIGKAAGETRRLRKAERLAAATAQEVEAKPLAVPRVPPTPPVAPPSVRTETVELSKLPDPEQMAIRVLIRRHRDEYDRLVEDMMAALEFDK